MDRATLEEKQKSLQTQFDTLNQQKADYQKQLGDIEAELFRLQGDYRTIEGLLQTAQSESTEAQVVDPLTVTAKEKKVSDAK